MSEITYFTDTYIDSTPVTRYCITLQPSVLLGPDVEYFIDK